MAATDGGFSEWSDKTYGENIHVPYEVKQDNHITFSLVLNLSETGEANDVKGNKYNGYKLSLYIDGKEWKSSYLNMEQWSNFKERFRGITDTFDIGVYRNKFNLSDGGVDWAYRYGKMSLDNLRFYTRPLDANEIKLNYDTRLAYDEAAD